MPELEFVVRAEGPLGVRLSYKKRGRLLFLESWDEVPSSPAHTSENRTTSEAKLSTSVESDNVASGEPPVAGPFLAAVRALRASPQSEPFIPALGDALVSVNGNRLEGLSFPEAVELIKAAGEQGGPRTFIVRQRELPSATGSQSENGGEVSNEVTSPLIDGQNAVVDPPQAVSVSEAVNIGASTEANTATDVSSVDSAALASSSGDASNSCSAVLVESTTTKPAPELPVSMNEGTRSVSDATKSTVSNASSSTSSGRGSSEIGNSDAADSTNGGNNDGDHGGSSNGNSSSAGEAINEDAVPFQPWKHALSREDAFRQALGERVDVKGSCGSPTSSDSGATATINDRALRQLAAGGCPDESGIRGVVWRYLLDQLPADRNAWPQHLANQRAQYKSFAALFPTSAAKKMAQPYSGASMGGGSELGGWENAPHLKDGSHHDDASSSELLRPAAGHAAYDPPHNHSEAMSNSNGNGAVSEEFHVALCYDAPSLPSPALVDSASIVHDTSTTVALSSSSNDDESQREDGGSRSSAVKKDVSEDDSALLDPLSFFAAEADDAKAAALEEEKKAAAAAAAAASDDGVAAARAEVFNGSMLAAAAFGGEGAKRAAMNAAARASAARASISPPPLGASGEILGAGFSLEGSEAARGRGASVEELLAHKPTAEEAAELAREEDRFLLTEISKDVVRTHPDLQFFLDETKGPGRYEALQRILFVYAKLNPGVRYVQGMNELVGALFYVLAAQSPQPLPENHSTTNDGTSINFSNGGDGSVPKESEINEEGSNMVASANLETKGDNMAITAVAVVGDGTEIEGIPVSKEINSPSDSAILPSGAASSTNDDAASSAKEEADALNDDIGLSMNQLWTSSDAESDAFYAFTALMGELRDVYVEDLDDSTTGIQGRMQQVDYLVSRHDPDLHEHLCNLGIDPTFYTLRWITTLLSREFDLPDVLRLWDALLSEKGTRNRERWLAYFCTSMVLHIRDTLLSCDFGDAIHVLQAYPTSVDIEALLRSASELRTLDWPNEDPYNPTDSVDKWPPPSPPPLKRSSLTAPGYVARLSSATATASSWAAAGNRIATNSRQMTRLALGFSSSSSGGGGGRHSIDGSSLQGGGRDGDESTSSNKGSPLSGGDEGGVRHSEGWSLSLRASSVDGKEGSLASTKGDVVMVNGEKKTVEGGEGAQKEGVNSDKSDADSGTDSNGPSPRARTSSLGGSSTFSSYSYSSLTAARAAAAAKAAVTSRWFTSLSSSTSGRDSVSGGGGGTPDNVSPPSDSGVDDSSSGTSESTNGTKSNSTDTSSEVNDSSNSSSQAISATAPIQSQEYCADDVPSSSALSHPVEVVVPNAAANRLSERSAEGFSDDDNDDEDDEEEEIPLF